MGLWRRAVAYAKGKRGTRTRRRFQSQPTNKHKEEKNKRADEIASAPPPMEDPTRGFVSRRRPRAETPAQRDVGPPRRRPRIDYQRQFGLTLGRPSPTVEARTDEPALRPREAAAQTEAAAPTPVGSWSLVQALPREVLAELIERMLATGGEAQVIGLCGSDREIQRLCQETAINARALGLPLPESRYSLIGAARALATSARRCILWAWLLAAQRVIDAATRRGPYTAAQRARLGRRHSQLAKSVDLNRVPYNDLLLWATSRSPETMPLKAQRIIGDDRTRPYLWRQLIVWVYGVPTGSTPYGMAPSLYADPSDPRSTLVALDGGSSDAPMPSHATLLDTVETSDAIRAGWLPPDFALLRLDQRQALVQTPEYVARTRARIIDALARALDGTALAGSDCARRLFDLFDVRVFVAPGTLRLDHYAAIRLGPADAWPYDPVDYWTFP
ncbi:hypothetical protein psal_cds_147 [Pandoravirus salinus]|uniref:Uncharacterized protein n=1 Tax=Pandoravirus salinus TaxID=1349410 RepID=S4W0K1_9VIRU|nr:hypothetical protein psal_cds_147 [Pandoravirus salinus]AGO83615.2 hypothetical protein psal_cds_147 [Pandoravirus salinus]